MEKRRLEYPDIAPAGPTYARAVKAGDTLYISGCTARGTDAEGGPPLDQLNGLSQIGKRAIDEFIAAVEHTEGKAAADLLRQWRQQVGATADD